jgi:hypothetical protein
MIRITITTAAFEAMAATLPSSVGFEAQRAFRRQSCGWRRRANGPLKCGQKRNWKLALPTQTPIPFAITLTLFAQFIPVDTSESKFSTFVAATLSIGPIRIYLDASRTKLESL